jgi:hypothetical protein
MHRLIMVLQGVIETQVVQFWYGIFDKELRLWVQDVTLL